MLPCKPNQHIPQLCQLSRRILILSRPTLQLCLLSQHTLQQCLLSQPTLRLCLHNQHTLQQCLLSNTSLHLHSSTLLPPLHTSPRSRSGRCPTQRSPPALRVLAFLPSQIHHKHPQLLCQGLSLLTTHPQSCLKHHTPPRCHASARRPPQCYQLRCRRRQGSSSRCRVQDLSHSLIVASRPMESQLTTPGSTLPPLLSRCVLSLLHLPQRAVIQLRYWPLPSTVKCGAAHESATSSGRRCTIRLCLTAERCE